MTKRKGIIICIISAAILLLSTGIVFAAYYGRGVFKDVFVNREYYFTSNILKDTTSVLDSQNTNVSAKISYSSPTQNVLVFNSNQATGEYHNYDITFSLYAWIDKDFTNPSDSYTITVLNSTPVILNNSSERPTDSTPTPIKTGLALEGNKLSSVSISINYNLSEDTVVNELPHLVLACKVDSPSFMTSRVLGGKLIPSQGEEFNLNSSAFYRSCGHASTLSSCSTKEYAAFTYRVSCTGNPSNTDKISITFDSSLLILDTYAATYDSLVENEGHTTITYSPTRNYILNIIFYRNTEGDWSSEKDTNESWSDLEALVVTTLVR